MVSVASVLCELKRVDAMLREMVYKYETQVEACNVQLKTPGSKLVPLIRRRKLLLQYITQCEHRMAVCLQKQCALEQVAVTKMQIEAIRKTSKVFKRFTHTHAIERVEKLQDDMVELETQLMDINELLMEPVINSEDLNIDDELAEMMTLCADSRESKESKESEQFEQSEQFKQFEQSEQSEQSEESEIGEEYKILLASI